MLRRWKSDTIKPRLEQAGADCNRVAFIKDDNGELTLEDERIKTAINQIGAKWLCLIRYRHLLDIMEI